MQDETKEETNDKMADWDIAIPGVYCLWDAPEHQTCPGVQRRTHLHRVFSNTWPISWEWVVPDQSGPGGQGINGQRTNGQNPGQPGGANSANQQNLNSASAYGGSALQGQIIQRNNSSGANVNQETDELAEINAEMKKDDASDDKSDLFGEGNSELNSESNSELNAESDRGDSSGYGTDNNSGGNSQLNSDNNPGDNSGGNSENNSNNNSGSGDNSGGNSGNNSGDNSGGGAGGNSGNDSGNGSGNNNQNNLPMINHIPSDSSVSKSVALQNQQNNALAAVLATRQALTIPVQQEAQATKYQSTNSSAAIPSPSTDQPPPDVQAKALAHQLTLH